VKYRISIGKFVTSNPVLEGFSEAESNRNGVKKDYETIDCG